MIEKLDEIEERYKELETQISDPDIMKDIKKYKEIAQEHAHLSETVEEIRQYKRIFSEIEDARSMLDSETDAEMKEMAQEELKGLESSLENSEANLKTLLIPKDPLDSKNIIMEIRAGTGGDEAALFAADLFRMYSRLAEHRKWKVEIMSSNEINLGGFKEIAFSVSGKSVYGDLKYESGVHRVQRVPSTESGGRVHTSAVTVAVLPEAEDTDIEIKQEDLKVDVYRSSGPGGQSVNTTDSAVRITHLPTGVVVTCQDEKSQIKNKAKAMRVLKARLFEAEEARKAKERSDARKSQVGSGDRSERIRTYNFPQNRLTDHRINLTLYKLDGIIEGAMDEVIESLKLSDREEALKANA
ncbi:MAG: peptide chain release factor 1 [Spirochaetales bacterium]|uniref:Peptide chain release factor 1 n=1 Tax=Candidatus Thalassospirochaeta sargassi TaxID=3119039 RepID=A0AAJ1IC96_9SPIO|nr:peptide chain release factor 1 [Spirochaetales bacterium]